MPRIKKEASPAPRRKTVIKKTSRSRARESFEDSVDEVFSTTSDAGEGLPEKPLQLRSEWIGWALVILFALSLFYAGWQQYSTQRQPPLAQFTTDTRQGQSALPPPPTEGNNAQPTAQPLTEQYRIIALVESVDGNTLSISTTGPTAPQSPEHYTVTVDSHTQLKHLIPAFSAEEGKTFKPEDGSVSLIKKGDFVLVSTTTNTTKNKSFTATELSYSEESPFTTAPK